MSLKVTVVGTGAAGLAIAAACGTKGHSVLLANRSARGLAQVAEQGGIATRCSGGPSTIVPVAGVSGDLGAAVRDSAVVFIAVGGHGAADVMAAITADLREGAMVAVVSGWAGAGLVCERVLATARPRVPMTVAEMAFPFVAAEDRPGTVHVHGRKAWIPAGCSDPAHRPVVRTTLGALFPALAEVRTPMWMALHAVPSLLIAVLVVANAARIRAGERFRFYRDGAFEELDRIVDELDRERAAIGARAGVRTMTTLEWLNRVYGLHCRGVVAFLRTCKAYARREMPGSFKHRFVIDHVPLSVVPLVLLGERTGVPTPTLSDVVAHASALSGRDLLADGEPWADWVSREARVGRGDRIKGCAVRPPQRRAERWSLAKR